MGEPGARSSSAIARNVEELESEGGLSAQDNARHAVRAVTFAGGPPATDPTAVVGVQVGRSTQTDTQPSVATTIPLR
jgi:hypothetical protein